MSRTEQNVLGPKLKVFPLSLSSMAMWGLAGVFCLQGALTQEDRQHLSFFAPQTPTPYLIPSLLPFLRPFRDIHWHSQMLPFCIALLSSAALCVTPPTPKSLTDDCRKRPCTKNDHFHSGQNKKVSPSKYMHCVK